MVMWLVLVWPLDRAPRLPGEPTPQFACHLLTLGLRATLVLAIAIALRGVFLFWNIAPNDWVDVRASHVLFEPLLAWLPGRSAVLAITFAFLTWALWRGLGNSLQLRYSTQLLSGVAVMILAFALLTYQRALPSIWTGFDGWEGWHLRRAASVWLYACAAALATSAFAAGGMGKRALDVCGFATAFAMASLASWAPIAALRMQGGNLTGDPPDVLHVISLTGRGALGGVYGGSAFLILLATMGTLMVFVFVLLRLWPGKHARIATALLVIVAWLPWPVADLPHIVRLLHGFGLVLSVLVGIAVARSLAPSVPNQERLAAIGGLTAAALAFASADRLFDYLPFLTGAGLTLLGGWTAAGAAATRN